LPISTPIESLMPIFELGYVAIVMDGDKFQGVITRIDLLNYLRNKTD
jgi:cystathionine beta-synthase